MTKFYKYGKPRVFSLNDPKCMTVEQQLRFSIQQMILTVQKFGFNQYLAERIIINKYRLSIVSVGRGN